VFWVVMLIVECVLIFSITQLLGIWIDYSILAKLEEFGS
jgi:hypothetical protein